MRYIRVYVKPSRLQMAGLSLQCFPSIVATEYKQKVTLGALQCSVFTLLCLNALKRSNICRKPRV